MLRFIRLAFLVVLGIVLLTIAFANRAPVGVRLLPEDIAGFMGYDWTFQLPLFLVVFASIIAGLGLGFIWEWFREAKHRQAATLHKRSVAKLEREVSRLRETKAEPQDEVLALLESNGSSR
jgi:uncharacterized integral membrane protein